MKRFWDRGYCATSMDDLVRETGVSRQGVYSAFKGKRALFSACLDAYREAVVTPAFAPVEAPGAGLDAVAAYFEAQIARAEAARLPGPGCLFANTGTELGAHDEDARARVRAHEARLRAGFRNALSGAGGLAAEAELDDLAALLATFAQGLWSSSRVATDAAPLRRSAAHVLRVVRERIEA